MDSLIGKVNAYFCYLGCGDITFTINSEEGMTPGFIPCDRCSLMKMSACYRLLNMPTAFISAAKNRGNWRSWISDTKNPGYCKLVELIGQIPMEQLMRQVNGSR